LAIGLWWTLYILSSILSRYVFQTSLKAKTVVQLISYSNASMLADALQVVEALFVVFIVHSVSKMEAKLDEELKKYAFYTKPTENRIGLIEYYLINTYLLKY
jgi:hypothetical protein